MEGNPIVRWLMDLIGVHPALALKSAVVLAIGWLLANPRIVGLSAPPAVPHILLAALCTFYAWLCWHNWSLIR